MFGFICVDYDFDCSLWQAMLMFGEVYISLWLFCSWGGLFICLIILALLLPWQAISRLIVSSGLLLGAIKTMGWAQLSSRIEIQNTNNTLSDVMENVIWFNLDGTLKVLVNGLPTFSFATNYANYSFCSFKWRNSGRTNFWCFLNKKSIWIRSSV